MQTVHQVIPGRNGKSMMAKSVESIL